MTALPNPTRNVTYWYGQQGKAHAEYRVTGERVCGASTYRASETPHPITYYPSNRAKQTVHPLVCRKCYRLTQDEGRSAVRGLR